MEEHAVKGRTLFEEEQIKERVRELAWQISADYRGQEIVLVGLLKGACMFLHDLGVELERLRADDPDKGVGEVYIDFLSISSYGDGHTPGALKLDLDIRRKVEGMHVLLVEDTADSCQTLAWVVDHMRKEAPATLDVCVFIEKPDKRERDVDLRYIGFSRPGLPFLGGYGMDDAEASRCVPYIFEVLPEEPSAE